MKIIIVRSIIAGICLFFASRLHCQTVDSCINCNFMGLTRDQWKIKDAPFWHKIDSAAIANSGGLYIGDLPSMIGSMVAGSSTCEWIFIEHPSIDTSIIEKHYYVRNGNHKEAIDGCGIEHKPITIQLSKFKKQ